MKIVVVVTEGVTLSLLDCSIGENKFFALRDIISEGAHGTLTSLPIPYEAPALLTAFSAALPGEHGCFSLWKVHSSGFTEIPETISSTDLQVLPIWRHPAAPLCTIVNVPGTHPPYPIKGSLISYPLRPTLRASFPSDLLVRLSRKGISYIQDVSALYTGEAREEFLHKVLRVEKARMDACLELLTCEGRLFVFNITILDRLCHFFWHEIDQFGFSPEALIWHGYELIDRFLTQVRSVLKSCDHLIVFSEMSFGPLKEFISFNNILESAGLLSYDGGTIDGRRSIAQEAVQGTHGINLNLRRRYVDGLISEIEEDAARREVQEALLSAIHPLTKERLVRDVLLGREVYPGKAQDSAPDLIILPQDERFLPLGNPHWARKVHRDLQTGWHRRDSFWCALGPRFRSTISDEVDCGCADICHTIADLLGISSPPYPGRSLCI